MLRRFTLMLERHFALLVLPGAGAGMASPEAFLWLKPHIPLMLGVVMFGIGLTIAFERLKEAVRTPSVWVLAVLKFVAMPGIAYGIAMLLSLPTELVIGMVILGACPGGVSANVMSYLAKANTTLAVMLTIVTTLLSPLLTPLVVYVMLREHVSMDLMAMMEKLFWVVLFPLFDAMVLRRFLRRPAMAIEWLCPPLSMLAITAIVAYVAAANRATLLAEPWLALAAVLLFNLGGYAVGYVLARTARMTPESCRAVAFEYGIQDSALGVIVASGFFTQLAALPSALCSVVQNLTGPILARRFTRN